MITDGISNVKAVYVYDGSKPLMRFEVDASGNPTNPRFYLEDAMGAVLGLANENGALLARFRYDGFGNERTGSGLVSPSSSTYLAPGTSGDFRFQGTWLEADSGLYHMRARDYEPTTGRFVERDPLEGSVQAPESFHAYAFADGNPYYYSDPTGEFSMVEINVSSAIQSGLQGVRTVAINKGKQYIQWKIGEFGANQFLNILKGFLPIDPSTLGRLQKGANSRYAGFRFGKFAEEFLCEKVGLPDSIYFEPQIRRTGHVVSSGVNCSSRGSQRRVLGPYPLSPRPDFVISPTAPIDDQGEHGRAYLIGEIKLSGQGLYRSYYRPKTQASQLDAILNYARYHTIPRLAVFGTLLRPTQNQEPGIRAAITGEAIGRGVAVLVVSVQ